MPKAAPLERAVSAALSPQQIALAGVAVAFAYYAGAQLGFRLQYPSSPLSILWPPNAVLLAALLLLPPRLFWLPLIAGFPAHVAVMPDSGWDRIIALYGTNFLQAILGAGLLWWVAGTRFALNSQRNVLIFIVVAVFVTPALASFPGTAAVVLTDFAKDFWFTWRLRFVSNVATTIALVPAALCFRATLAALRDTTPSHILEAAILFVSLAILCVASFGDQPSIVVLPFLLSASLPLLLWLAIRFGLSGTSLGLLGLTAMTFINVGRWEATLGPDEARLLVQVFLVIVSAPALLLAAYSDERRHALEAISKVQQRYRLATTAGMTGVWDWDLATDDIYVDPVLKKLLGFGGDEIPNRRSEWDKRVHPDDARLVMARARAHIAGDTPSFEVEHRILHRDGSTRWFLARGKAVRDPNGAAIRIVGTYTDVSERRRAQDDLQAIEHLSRAVLSSLHDAVAIVDREGCITTVNEAWLRFASEAENRQFGGIGRGANYLEVCRELAAGGDVNAIAIADAVAEVLAGKSSNAVLEYAAVGTASPRWFELSVVPLRRPEGGAVVTHSDVSERKRIDAELQRIRRELAHAGRVSMLGELSGAMAHELNQPLTAILSNAQAAQHYLRQSPVDLEEMGSVVADLLADGKRAGEVIRRMRGLMRKGDVRRQPIDINQIVGDVLKLAHGELITRNVRAAVRLSSSLPPVMGDPVQLQQLLLNLLVNAAESMSACDPSDRHVTIATERDHRGGILASVSDCGEGLPVEMLERVFEPFYTTKAHGLGLGLAICRSIVEAHGGRLWASNNADRGATFKFWLPVAGERQSLSAAATTEKQPPPVPSAPGWRQ